MLIPVAVAVRPDASAALRKRSGQIWYFPRAPVKGDELDLENEVVRVVKVRMMGRKHAHEDGYTREALAVCEVVEA